MTVQSQGIIAMLDVLHVIMSGLFLLGKGMAWMQVATLEGENIYFLNIPLWLLFCKQKRYTYVRVPVFWANTMNSIIS